jgi:CDP-diacylglycerol--serine O-phosphatidyltransferase
MPDEQSTEQKTLAPRRLFPPRLGRDRRPGKRMLQSTSVLPGLFTIANGLAGFASIHFATKDALGEATLVNLSIAAWLIFVAMAFDMLDGRVARMTRRTSDFGGQLDSLCDIISFGAAPAMLMVRAEVMALHGQIERLGFMPHSLGIERVVWCVAAVYVACGALRLARFNVENVPDESAHFYFKGLPIPGAAAPVAALVLLLDRLAGIEQGWRSSPWLLAAVGTTLPVMTLLVASLMVSRFTYTHVVNHYIRGKRPFNYLVKLVIIALAAMVEPYLTLAGVTIAYAFSGLAGTITRRLAARKALLRQPSPTQAGQ